jgi:hypothetical protein
MYIGRELFSKDAEKNRLSQQLLADFGAIFWQAE